MKPKPSERIRERIENMRSVQGWTEPWSGGCFERTLLEFLDEHAHVFTPAPVEEREAQATSNAAFSYEPTEDEKQILEGDDPKERGDGDAQCSECPESPASSVTDEASEDMLQLLRDYLIRDGVEVSKVCFWGERLRRVIDYWEAERARNAEEVERLRCQIKMELDAGVRGRNDARARIAELENLLTESLISHGHDSPCAQMMAAGGALECECALPDGMRAQLHEARTRAEKAEAEAAELRERLYRFRTSLVTIDLNASKQTEDTQDSLADYFDELFPDGEVTGIRAPDLACMFSETVKVDIQTARIVVGADDLTVAVRDPRMEALATIGVPEAYRFEQHHCRITVEALFPIGEAAEVSKPEGRDA